MASKSASTASAAKATAGKALKATKSAARSAVKSAAKVTAKATSQMKQKVMKMVKPAKSASKAPAKVAGKAAAPKKAATPAPAKGAGKKAAPVPAAPSKFNPSKFNGGSRPTPKPEQTVKTKGMTMPLPPPPPPKERRRGVPGSPLRGLNLSMRNANRSANSDSVCREVACEGLATSSGYCRLHYIKNWKMLKRKELILKEGKLNQYIEELVAKYPDKYIEAIKQDLSQDKEFNKVVADLELDEGVDEFDGEQESLDGVIDTVRRDFDDEGESF